MRAFSLAALSVAALALFSSAPTACGAALAAPKPAPVDVATQCQAILVDAKAKIAPIKAELAVLLTKDNLSSRIIITTKILPVLTRLNLILVDAKIKILAIKKPKAPKEKRQVDSNAVANARQYSGCLGL